MIQEELRSIEAYQTAVLTNPPSKQAPIIYGKIAYAYLQIHNYKEAIEYADLAINLLEKKTSLDEREMTILQEVYFNGANASHQIKEEKYFRKAEHYYRKGDSLARYLDTPLSDFYDILNDIAYINTEINQTKNIGTVQK